MSNSEKKGKIPDAPTPVPVPGNLLSSVAPPSQLPNFVTTSAVPSSVAEMAPQPPVSEPVVLQPALVQHREASPAVMQHMDTTPQVENFSPAIPLSKGEPMMSIRSPEDSQATQSPDSLPDSTPEVDKLDDSDSGSDDDNESSDDGRWSSRKIIII